MRVVGVLFVLTFGEQVVDKGASQGLELDSQPLRAPHMHTGALKATVGAAARMGPPPCIIGSACLWHGLRLQAPGRVTHEFTLTPCFPTAGLGLASAQ